MERHVTAHAVGGFIGWTIAAVLGAVPAWALSEWGREVLFGPRDRAKKKGKGDPS
jgi:hypothetical protein